MAFVPLLQASQVLEFTTEVLHPETARFLGNRLAICYKFLGLIPDCWTPLIELNRLRLPVCSKMLKFDKSYFKFYNCHHGIGNIIEVLLFKLKKLSSRYQVVKEYSKQAQEIRLKLVHAIQSQPLMKWPRRVNYSLRVLALQEPALWPLYHVYHWSDQLMWNGVVVHPKEKAVRKGTELVIDGFPGSANTFAFKSFNRSQTRPVQLGHHTHAPAQILKAIKMGIPVWLVIREPAGAIVSQSSRWPHISVTQSLLSYIGFYTKLKPYASDCLISTFEQHTQHIDRVVQAVNAKFGTQFDGVDLAKAQAEHKAFTTQQDKDNPERAAILKVLKQEKIKELATEKNSKLLAQANALYKTFEELAQKTVQL